jgi:D-amino-acid dehydrogenase
MSSGRALAEQLAPLGLRFDVLDRDGAIAAEPALEGIREQIAGALRFPDDGVGDSFKFCEALTDAFRHAGGELRTGVQVSGIAVDRGKAVGVISSAGRVRADTVVVAAGRATPGLVRHLGIALPIRPVKGYTVTFDASRVEGRPAMAVIDNDLHAAIVPLGTRLRVAGTAEFAGEDLRLRPERIENLLKLLSAIYPRIAARLDLAGGYAWTGLRPMSADGLPFVGATRVPGLYINAGHGHLGWTHACGSAHLVADLIAGGLTEIDPEPYRATR